MLTGNKGRGRCSPVHGRDGRVADRLAVDHVLEPLDEICQHAFILWLVSIREGDEVVSEVVGSLRRIEIADTIDERSSLHCTKYAFDLRLNAANYYSCHTKAS